MQIRNRDMSKTCRKPAGFGGTRAHEVFFFEGAEEGEENFEGFQTLLLRCVFIVAVMREEEFL